MINPYSNGAVSSYNNKKYTNNLTDVDKSAISNQANGSMAMSYNQIKAFGSSLKIVNEKGHGATTVDKIKDVLFNSDGLGLNGDQKTALLRGLTNTSFLQKADTAVNKDADGIIDENDINTLIGGLDNRNKQADKFNDFKENLHQFDNHTNLLDDVEIGGMAGNDAFGIGAFKDLSEQGDNSTIWKDKHITDINEIHKLKDAAKKVWEAGSADNNKFFSQATNGALAFGKAGSNKHGDGGATLRRSLKDKDNGEHEIG